jgi:hypothetical protein
MGAGIGSPRFLPLCGFVFLAATDVLSVLPVFFFQFVDDVVFLVRIWRKGIKIKIVF